MYTFLRGGLILLQALFKHDMLTHLILTILGKYAEKN